MIYARMKKLDAVIARVREIAEGQYDTAQDVQRALRDELAVLDEYTKQQRASAAAAREAEGEPIQDS